MTDGKTWRLLNITRHKKDKDQPKHAVWKTIFRAIIKSNFTFLYRGCGWHSKEISIPIFFKKTTLDWWVTFVFIIEKYLAFYVLYKAKFGLRLVRIHQFIPLYTVLMPYKWSLIILNMSLFGSKMSPKILNGNTVLCLCVATKGDLP